MSILTTPVFVPINQRQTNKPKIIPGAEIDEQAKNKGKSFYACYRNVFIILCAEWDMGAIYHEKSKQISKEEILAKETALKFVTYCSDGFKKPDHKTDTDNVVRRNPETGRWDYFYHPLTGEN